MVQIPLHLARAGRGATTGRRIYERVKGQIVSGALPVGSPLPSTRALAWDLGVSRTTVTSVYEQLAAEGYLETTPRAKPRVAAGVAAATRAAKEVGAVADVPPRLSAYGRRAAEHELPPAGDPDHHPAFDFLYGALASRDFPTLSWRKAYGAVLRQRQPRLSYAAPEGEGELRNVLQGYLVRARGLVCDPEQILIVQGSQQAIDLCARLLVDPGDRVVLEDPCYQMARWAFEAVGARPIAVPVDDHGLVTTMLTSQGRIRLAYVTPSHQFPLGSVMPIGRRGELLEWARRHHAYVVEDDYDGEFRYGMRPIDALQSIDESGSVIYVGTFSKALSPQIRLGYVVLPRPLVPVFRATKALTDRHAPRLEQLTLASLIRSGAYERHVRRARRENERRRAALMHALDRHMPGEAEIEGAAAGLHVVLWLKHVHRDDENALVASAREYGVGLTAITPLYAKAHHRRRRDGAGVIVGYASLSSTEIELGVRKFATVLSRVSGRGRAKA